VFSPKYHCTGVTYNVVAFAVTGDGDAVGAAGKYGTNWHLKPAPVATLKLFRISRPVFTVPTAGDTIVVPAEFELVELAEPNVVVAGIDGGSIASPATAMRQSRTMIRTDRMERYMMDCSLKFED